MALTKVSGEVITRPLVLTGNASVSGIITVGTGSSATTIDGSYEYPSIRPTLDLNFAATKTLDRRITFTRDSLGTYTDELGIVRTVSNNTPRFDHDPTTGESLGLLIEEERTNINKISTFRVSSVNRFSINSDSEQTAGENTNGVVGPDGTAKGVARAFFTGSESDPSGSVYVMASTSSSNGADFTTTNTHTSSVWIRPGLETEWKVTAHSAYASATAGGSGTTIDFIFTLTGDGSVKSIETGGIAASVKKYPNNWYRCTITYHRNSTGSVSSGYGVIIYPNVYYSYNAQSQTGDIGWFWGPQVEEGAFPTSYIPTSGSTVTRAQDFASIKGTNFDFYNQSEGTIVDSCTFINEVTSSFSGGNPRVYTFSDGSVENTLNRLRTSSVTSDRILVRSGNAAQSDLQAAYTSTLSSLVAVSYKVDDFRLQTSDGSVATDDGGAVPSGVTQLTFGTYDLGAFTAIRVLNGTIKRFTYYPKRLPNSQLKGLTAQ